ncbi:P-loop containing nucleoside triphosphate hydrolase protein [Crassisporium funariophilum]|nr:P-loop containing nucleoside triphosphate hydrolase protein [Crassisporium funariophilum]
MAKKKKTQLKPVARGFATVSMPKKAVELQSDNVDSSSVQSSSEPEHHDAINEQDSPLPSNVHPSEEFDPDLVDEQSLQNIIDKFQDKTEKEITRTIKSVEVDRRFSQTLPRLDIDPALRDRILYAAVDSPGSDGQKLTEESEEKATARLGITYGVLRRLGYGEDRVEECLRSIGGVELDEAFDWLYLHCSEEEVATGTVEAKDPGILRYPSGVTAHNHPTIASPSTPRLEADSPLLRQRDIVCSDSSSAPTLPTKDEKLALAGKDIANIKARILSSCSTDSDTANIIEQEPRSQNVMEELKVLRDMIKETSKDYFFDEKEAHTRYTQAREQAKNAALQERLRSVLPVESGIPAVIVEQNHSKPQTASLTRSTESAELFEEDDREEDSSGGVLGFLEDLTLSEVNVRGVTITIRDMALPKHWSGQTPKTMLRDLVNKADRYAAISYSNISNHSRAKQANVTISWQSRKRDEWVMDKVGCPEASQAEQYIATVALHALTYPLTVGFAASAASSAGSQTSFRLLPAVYRDLWDEFEASRKVRDNAVNRKSWAKLRSILDFKLENNMKIPNRQLKPSLEKQASEHLRTSNESRGNPTDPLATAFQARLATVAYQEMIVQRNQLPIAQYRNEIIDILDQSQVLVLSGETGCGKSTQVPAFILEDCLSKGKPCKIYCTEPRRISAISLAQRVSYELCDPPNSVGSLNSLVGYSIRLESNISRNTRLAFVTNGIALRMLEGGSGPGGRGSAFDEITHIIVDEVHERTIESDFLLIVLKSMLEQRSDLKVILMSATIDADKISNYFGNCQTLHVPGRTFPVDIRYLEDAIEYTKWSISESSPYARRLHDKYYKGRNRPEWTEDTSTLEEEDEDGNDNRSTALKLEKRYSPETATTLNTIDERLIPYDLIIRLLEMMCFEDAEHYIFSSAVLVFMPGLAEIRRLNDLLMDHPRFGSTDFKLYPLHSSLTSDSQGAVFDIPPRGIRKIVIATNIAETGITIPDITCVIDSGKHREMRFDEKRQISRLVETFVAKSNAAQRRGRAGRVQHGLCFHLFTKVRHDTQMADSPLPEMMRLSLSDLALRIKIMKVKLGTSIEDVLARALDPPVSVNVQRAISMLVEVRALTPSEEITPMGRLLSKLPTDVHLGKFLLIASLFRCLDPALTIAAALNSKSPFVAPLGLEQEADRAKNSFRIENSDFLTIHNAFSSWRQACGNPGFVRKFCRTNYLSHQNLQQIEDLRQQFLGYLIDSSFIQVDTSMIRELSRARYGRNRTRFMTVPAEFDVNSKNHFLVHAALTGGLYPKILSVDPKNGQMRTITNNQHASFHPSSVNFGRKAADFGNNHLVYFTLMHSKKLYAWETAPVDDIHLLLLCGECDFKLVSDMASIDRRIKLYIPPKTNVALKILREQLTSVLAQQYQGKALTATQAMWKEIGLLALSKVKIKREGDDLMIV